MHRPILDAYPSWRSMLSLDAGPENVSGNKFMTGVICTSSPSSSVSVGLAF